MTRRKRTDGECIANVTKGLGLVAKHHLAARIDRLVRRRMAEAWDQGHDACFRYEMLTANPYRKKRAKS